MAKPTVIGLDIGTTHVRAVELRFGAGGPSRGEATLVRCGQVPLPPGAVRDAEVIEPQTVATALRQLWSDAGFTSKDVVIGVGNQRVLVREIELPSMPLPQLRASLPYQAQELLPMAAGDALLDFYPTSEIDTPEGRTVTGFFVAAVRETVTANVLACEAAGLAPAMVDLNGFALLRSLTAGTLKDKTVAIVDIGARVTNVVIADRGVPRFVRVLPAGGQDATDAVASAMQVTAPEAEKIKRELGIGYAAPAERADAAQAIVTVTQTLIESIQNTFAYYSSANAGSRIETIVLTGGGVHLAGLGQYLSTASRTSVILGNPFETLGIEKSVQRDQITGHESSYALSIGLAYGVAA